MHRTRRLENEATPAAKPVQRATVQSRERVWRTREHRLALAVPVAYRATGASEWMKAATRSLSRSGLLMSTEQPIANGTALEFVFEMPAEISGQQASRVLCRGIVARSQLDKNSGGFLVATTIAGYRFLQNDAGLASACHRRVRTKGNA
jgi:hypothetical protein